MNKKQSTKLSLEILANEIFTTLASTFPIACASDEFYYFPHVQLSKVDWSIWDDFSSEKIVHIVHHLASWEKKLEYLSSVHLDSQTQVDIDILRKLTQTLLEQLSEVRNWESQPTFYLTIASIGIVEAVESNESEAKHLRAKNLPYFLDRAVQNLKSVPIIFRDLAIEMLSDTKIFFKSLKNLIPELGDAITALNRFENALQRIRVCDHFNHSQDLVNRIIYSHLQIEMDLKDLKILLDKEIEEMKQNLRHEMIFFIGDQNDQLPFYQLLNDVLQKIPGPGLDQDGLIELYRNEVNNLARHCREQGFLSAENFKFFLIQVAPMPSYLSAIRAASSYSISPRFPEKGGNFYVLNTYLSDLDWQCEHREYRLLSSHETYPGHHVLDTCRLTNSRSLRRHIENPLFYEGWACFAEEMMRLTGYFKDPTDRFLLYKRRLWRAVRGKVDLGLQMGTMDIATAARFLEKTGVGKVQAWSSARKYPLNPGYQLCYTVGLHRFLESYDRYGTTDLSNFSRTVLGQGEIGFINLENIFKNIGI